MIVQSGNVAMTSRRSYERTTAMSSSLTLWGSGFMKSSNAQLIDHYSEKSETGGQQEESANSRRDSTDDLLGQFRQAQSISSPVVSSRPSPIQMIQSQSISYLLQLLLGTGRFARHSFWDSLAVSAPSVNQQFGGEYTEASYYAEQETTTFSTTGTVKTADGRQIDFKLSMTMSRSFEESYAGSASFGAALNQANLCDPLVINLNTGSANVTDQEFYFDLDADGNLDHISNLASGSGFLALDKNGDGIINDGNELFGTHSGDGFADLAAFDEDGNGWIDENDSIFDKLCIWTKDSSGRNTLCAIGKAGIGAIYLGNTQTEFSLNSAKDNSTNALIRKTGIFLYENGNVGTVQHLDMVR